MKLILYCCLSISLLANPFVPEMFVQECHTEEDWLLLQQTLRTLDLEPLLRQMYLADQGYTTFEDFLQRASRGIRQTLIDPARGLFPQKSLEKIGLGSDLCIVSYASYDDLYPEFVQANAIALETVGFHGYYLYAIADFPKRYLKYAGVPYTFKMGMIREAQKLGFTKVLWIDSAMMPLRDPTPLFDWIEQKGAIFLDKPPFATLWRYIFPETCQILAQWTGTDVLQARHIWGAIFGFKLDTPETISLLESYDRLVALGTPFLSCFPEQFVLTALVGQNKYKHWLDSSIPNLLDMDFKQTDPKAEIESLRQAGYYFYLRRYK